MKSEKIRKKRKQAVSIGLAAVLAFSTVGNVVWAEESAGKQERLYQVGTMQVLFQDQAERGSDEYVEVHVLHDKNSDTVWVNGSEFAGYLEDYNYFYDEEEKTAEISVRNRQIGFQTGGSIIGYKIGDNEGFYRMDEPVVKYDETVWIPAEEFFHFLGCNTVPIAKDGDTTEWTPTEDYLLVMNPQKNVIDVLEQIFAKENGAYWMFDYEDDFAQYSENVEEKFEKAKDALGIYESLTLDLDRIADNVTSAGSDFTYEYMKENFGIEVVDYDAKEGIKEFIDRMLNPSESLIRAGEEHIGAAINLAERVLETVDTSTEYMEEVIGTIDSTAGNLQAALKTDYDEIKGLIANSDKFGEAIDTGTLAVSVGLEIFGVLQRIVNHDESILKAMDYYLNTSNVKNTVFTELELQFAERSNDYIYAAYESAVIIIKQSAEKIIEETLKKAGFSVVSFIGSMNNLLWYALEQTGWASSEKINRVVIDINIGDKKLIDIDTDTSLATVDEAKAMRMSVYGIMYELDALKELKNYYYDILLGNGLRSQRDLTACAYLALNYLQSCYITTEAALSAFAHANVEDTESSEDAWISYRTKKFADTDLYKQTQKRNEEIAEMITVLTEALPYGTDPSLSSVEETENEAAMPDDRRAVRDRLFGVIVSGTDFSTNDLNYEVFIAPSTMEEGKSYRYYAPVFEAEERVILPLVNFGGVVNNGGNFVKYQDDTYYWKLADGSVEEGAMYALFAVDENVIQQLVRRNGSGQETVVLEDTCHDTEIYICGDTLYYKPKYNQWTAFDLSENQKKNSYESMYVVGVDEERGLLLCEITGTGMVALNSEGDMSVIETTSFNYLGSLNGKYYYTLPKDDYNAVEFFSYDIEKQQKESIGSISKDELGIENLDNIYVAEVHFNDGYLYATVGGVMGTAMFFVGGVYRSDLKGEMIKIIPSVDFDKIYIEENQDGDDILYYTNSGAGYSATGGGFLFADQGVQAFNLETGEVSQTDFVISSIGDAIVMNGGIYSLLDTGGQYTEIVSHELAERMGYADMGQEQGDSLVIARELDIVDDMAYVSICRVYEDSAYSLGWRPGYRRDIIETFAVEIGTNKAVKLDSY